MKNKIFTFLLISAYCTNLSFGQNVGINGAGTAPNASAMLDVESTNRGLLIPRVVLTANNVAAPVTSPATSLLIYNTASAGTGSTAVSPGYYYWDGTKWVALAGSNGRNWALEGNAGTTPPSVGYGSNVDNNFLGTTDAQDLTFATNNLERMRIKTDNSTQLRIGMGTAFTVNLNTGSTPSLLHLHDWGTSTNDFAALNLSSQTTASGNRTGLINFAATSATNERRAASIESYLTAASGTNVSGDLRFFTNNANTFAERMRILSNGRVSVNNGAPFNGDVFSVYGTNYAGAISAIGGSAINGYVGAGGIGVYAESFTAGSNNNGIAILGVLDGVNTPNANVSLANYGLNTTTPAGTGIALGVSGEATSTTGDARGVEGISASPNGIGVSAFNDATTGNAIGMYSQTSSAAGIGVFGINTAAAYATNTAIGVFGRTFGSVTTGLSMGVRGLSDATTGNGYGLYGQSSSSAGFGGIGFATSSAAGLQGQNAGTGNGVAGLNTNATAANAGNGVLGQTNATTAFGGRFVNQNALGTGLLASGNNVAGQYLARGSGIAGVGTQFGVVGFATTMVNTNASNNAPANAANASAGGYFEVQNAGTAQTWAYVGVRDNGNILRKIIGPGTVNTIVKDLEDNLVVLSCPETPENLFQDYGVAKLSNGKCHIEIDPIFSKNIIVNEKHPLRVFIQLEGDCEGVYVTNKSQTGFDVIELKSGKSNVTFAYTIVANRADEILPDGTISKYSQERFPYAPGPQTSVKKEPETNLIQTPLNDFDKYPAQSKAGQPEIIKTKLKKSQQSNEETK